MGKNRYMDGFQCLSSVDNDMVSNLPVSIAVAISKGDILTLTSGYLVLATTFGTGGAPDLYVALGQCTAAEAVASGTISIPVIHLYNPYRWMAPVAANTVLIQATHVGAVYDLDGSEDALTVAAALTKDIGFLVEEIDISTAALAVNTYGYAIGRFMWFSETT